MGGGAVLAESVDCIVIGAGIIGLAIARSLTLQGRDVVIAERANAFGAETSSRNSEVIHAGIYYPKGSLKARLCVAGKQMLYDYAGPRGIACTNTGKLIVATTGSQQPRLDEIVRQAAAAGVTDLRPLSRADVGALEPEVDAVAGLFSPSTGIIDSHALMLSLLGDFEAAGGALALNTPVVGGRPVDGGMVIEAGGAESMTIEARTVVNAGGLWAQEIAASLGVRVEVIPPRHLAIGHYYALGGKSPFRHLVYPVPEPGGLGIHATLDMAGQARFGPDVRWIEDVDYSFDDSRRADFVTAVRHYYPALDSDRLTPAYTGIRPKLTGPGGGFADFRIDGPEAHGVAGLVNLYGIESPGLTAALAIAEDVAARLQTR